MKSCPHTIIKEQTFWKISETIGWKFMCPVPFRIKEKFSVLQRILFKGTRMMVWNMLQEMWLKWYMKVI